MKKKVLKKVKSSIDSGITEREMNSIAKAMWNDYYAIYQAHKHDINVLAPKTGDFLRDLRAQNKQKRDAEQKEQNSRRLSAESLAIIKAIDIDGSVKSSEEFLEKLEKLKTAIQKTEEYQNSTDIEKQNIMDWIDGLDRGIRDGRKTQINFLNGKFNGLAQQIDRQDEDGNIEINLGGGMSIDVATKQEAFDFIEQMKKDAEDEFESIWKDIGWWLGNIGWWIGWFFGWLGFGLLTATPKLLFAPWRTTDKHDMGWPLTWALYGLAAILSINYAETLYRRILKDTVARFTQTPKAWKAPKETGKEKGFIRRSFSDLKIPDYNTVGTY